jgi:hypothetical protein
MATWFLRQVGYDGAYALVVSVLWGASAGQDICPVIAGPALRAALPLHLMLKGLTKVTAAVAGHAQHLEHIAWHWRCVSNILGQI